MAQSVSQIRSDIENTKGQISQTFNELEDRFQEMKDWRGTVQHYPIPSVLISAAVGLLFSGIFTQPMLRITRKSAGQVFTGVVTGVLIRMVQQNMLGESGSKVPRPSKRLFSSRA